MADSAAAPVPTDLPPAQQQEGKVVEEQPGIKLFAGNLNFQTTSEDLKEFFAKEVSDILSCEVIKRGTRSVGYGFVAVSSDESAKKAIDALNGQEFQERKIIVAFAKPAEEKEKERSERKTKRRSGRRGTKAVPGEVTEAEANGEADKAATATDAEGEGKPKKKKKRSIVKKFRNKVRKAPASGENGAAVEGGEAAATSDGEKKKRSPRPKRTPKPRRPAGEEPAGEQSKTTLFVANLPFSLNDDGLGDIFKKAGFTVEYARVVRWRWGRPRKSKGYGFVSLVDEEQQKKALEQLQGSEVPDPKAGTRKIALKIAVDAPHEDSDGEKGAEKGDAPAGEAPAAGATEATA